VLRYWQRWKEHRRLAHLDAERLLEEFGNAAYEVAWTVSREIRSGAMIDSRPEGHWDRVLRVIARQSLLQRLRLRARPAGKDDESSP
jgi:hypothetical protein